jgi:GT2 family glycosyltransferase
MFEKYGLFRTDLGPRPGSEIRNEDTEFGRRLLAAGERLLYEPSAVVYHPLPEERLSQGYVLDWWFDHGRAVIREKGKRPSIWGIPRGFFDVVKMTGRVLPSYVARWIVAENKKERFRWKCAVWCTAGQIRETFRMAGESDRTRLEYIPSISGSGADQ